MAEPIRPKGIPASIWYNNPGAMWGGKRAEKWGATSAETLHDGLGQGNNIANFPTKVQGAAAQFDLWKSNYVGLSLGAAISKWSGGNSSPAYAAFLRKQSGLELTEIILPSLLASPRGLALIKAQAEWEAGKPYPMTDTEWQEAQSMVFRGAIASTAAQPAPPVSPQPVPAPKPAPIQPASPAPPQGSWLAALINAVLAVFRRK